MLSDNSILTNYLPGVDDPNTLKLIKKVATVRLDVQVGTDFTASVTVEATDLDEAKELKPVLVKFANTGKVLLNQFIPQLGELGKNLTITSKDKTITVKTSLAGKTIEDLMTGPKDK
jgi:hypothetical protein